MDAFEHTRDFDRHGCIVGARHVKYTTLEQWYVCANCGGQPLHKMRSVDKAWVDWAECSKCGTRDFLSQRFYDRQCQEYYEIAEGLPPEMAALLPTPKQAVWDDETRAAWDSASALLASIKQRDSDKGLWTKPKGDRSASTRTQ